MFFVYNRLDLDEICSVAAATHTLLPEMFVNFVIEMGILRVSMKNLFGVREAKYLPRRAAQSSSLPELLILPDWAPHVTS